MNIPSIEEYIEREVLPEERLLLAVLDAAIVDLFSKERSERRVAKQWFTYPSNSAKEEKFIAYLDIMEHFDLEEYAERFYLTCVKNSVNFRRSFGQ